MSPNRTSASATDPPFDLPEDIIVSILKRLPVKSILRFKCVSKDWLSLLSTPNFISIHLQETSNNPMKDSFIIRSSEEDPHYIMSLLNVNSIERVPFSLFNRFHWLLREMRLVGSINGLVCLRHLIRETVVLWNPAMNLYKLIRLSRKVIRIPKKMFLDNSVGFAYDPLNDDYKIIKIACVIPQSLPPEMVVRSCAEVYSASLDSWKRVHIDFPFVVSASANQSNVIANGIPYWTAYIYQANNHREFRSALVYYDIRNESFKHVPLPILPRHYGSCVQFVEWKGNLGVVHLSSPRLDRDEFVDVFVYDEMGMCWNKISSHGPIGSKMHRPLQCSKHGVILVDGEEGNMILCDPVTNGIREFSPGDNCLFLEAFTYTESLVTVKGMEQVTEEWPFDP